MTNEVYLMPSTKVIAGLDDDYKEKVQQANIAMQKMGLRAYLDDVFSRMEETTEWLYKLPHPTRKQWVGFVPLHIELGLQEEASVAFLLDQLAEEQVNLGRIITDLSNHSPSFANTIKQLTTQECAETGTNLGHLDPILFPHVFGAKGGRLFKIDDSLTEKLDNTDIGAKTPAMYLRPLYSNMFIHASPDIYINNPQSGEHRIDGIYVNLFTIGQEQLDREWEDRMAEKNASNMNLYFAQKGYLKRDGGDVRALNILVTAQPKATLFDDAVYSYTILIQDETMDVETILQHHIDYYSTLEERVAEEGGNRLWKPKSMKQRDVQTATETLEFLAKCLLYINSEDCIKQKVMDFSDTKMAIKRTQNKAKIRRLERKLKAQSNHIVISYQGGEDSPTPQGLGCSKSTHWRRGHFREQRYGKGRALSKMKWISPTLVGSGPSQSKSYSVK